MFLLGRFLPRSAAFAMFAPANPMPSEVQLEDPYQGTARVGDMGVAISTLRPAGKARFGSVVVDVVTQGDYLDPNARLEVIERRGNRVVVRSAK
ncbi:MAG: NfeD family protein, partial [Planctomycetes bacterium]|nr:NfeD family protein [Planctomycetota bacterium]